jgi:hypothetical protein
VKFLRQSAVVLAIAAVLTVIGLAWNHFGPASLPGEGLTGGQFAVSGHPPKGAKLPPGAKRLANGHLAPGARLPAGAHRPPPGTRIINGGAVPVDLGDMLKPVNLAVFRQTVVLEAEIMAGVVILSIGARKWRQARRRRMRAGRP